MHIHSKLIGTSGPAEITCEVADTCKTRKKNACPASALFQCFLIRSDAPTRGAPPPPVIRPPNAVADHQFVGAQLYPEPPQKCPGAWT